MYASGIDTGLTLGPLLGGHKAQGSLELSLYLWFKILELKPPWHPWQCEAYNQMPNIPSSTTTSERISTMCTFLPSCVHTLICHADKVIPDEEEIEFCNLVKNLLFPQRGILWEFPSFLFLPTFPSILLSLNPFSYYHVMEWDPVSMAGWDWLEGIARESQVVLPKAEHSVKACSWLQVGFST